MDGKSVKFDFEIETVFGVLPSYHLEVPDTYMGLKEIVPFVMQVSSDIVSQAAAVSVQEGKKVQCNSGCSGCCYYPLPVSVPEAIFFVEHLQRMPFEKRRPILEGFERNEVQCVNRSLIDPLRMCQSGIDNIQTGKAYFELNLPCPFLRENKCSIHTLCPITCREHNVISDAELCKNPFSGKTIPLGLQRHYSERLQAVAHTLCNTGKGNVMMPLLFEWYENHKDIAEKRWRGPELFAITIEFTVGNNCLS
jgi:Fe-S-cluster containining protein